MKVLQISSFTSQILFGPWCQLLPVSLLVLDTGRNRQCRTERVLIARLVRLGAYQMCDETVLLQHVSDCHSSLRTQTIVTKVQVRHHSVGL